MASFKVTVSLSLLRSCVYLTNISFMCLLGKYSVMEPVMSQADPAEGSACPVGMEILRERGTGSRGGGEKGSSQVG